MPTHMITVTLTCDDEGFTYDEAVEYLNDHLTADFDPPGFGSMGTMTRYNGQGVPIDEVEVEWVIE